MAELFDEYAKGYDQALSQALSASGEGRDYFAKGRVAWLARCLAKLGIEPKRVFDFGCGDGATTPLLLTDLAATSALGADVSELSLVQAREKYGAANIEYVSLAELKPSGDVDVAYCNGVFHHIVPKDRDTAVAVVRDSLKPGGLFSLWENNPWNPATRYVMAKCPFDEDAIMLSSRETRRLLRKNGFEIVRTDFRFIFPRALRVFRGLENLLYRTPLGTQYQVLARKV
jgi:SAM-dependent methyltransferase